jgi:hypothetical protein
MKFKRRLQNVFHREHHPVAPASAVDILAGGGSSPQAREYFVSESSQLDPEEAVALDSSGETSGKIHAEGFDGDGGSSQVSNLVKPVRSMRRNLATTAAVGAVTVSSISGPVAVASVRVKVSGKATVHTVSVRDVSQKRPTIKESDAMKFHDLADQWREETCFLSSLTRIVSHPAYREIIDMGEAAVPLILEELRKQPNHWFYALHEITGASPVSTNDAGDIRKMTQAWVEWGIKNHYLKP